jgi:lysophospholipase
VTTVDTPPFRAEIADAPQGGEFAWRHADDGVRLRLGLWRARDARGTVLLFPGRTEYLEKYGRVVGELTSAGWSVASLDWRGQGLSDRLDGDTRLGHVADFIDYQRDVAVLSDWLRETDLPGPRVMLAHSMGGCIGLRALVNGLAVERAVFSAPMWGIQMPTYMRPLTYMVPPIARFLRKENTFAPGTKPVNYITETGFPDNMLTTCPETYGWLGEHAAFAPEFALGGPSVQWVGSAIRELGRLFSEARPNVPCLTFVGTLEQIVSIEAIERYHASWPAGELRVVAGAKHEMMMETPVIRDRFMSDSLDFFGIA